MLRTPTLFGSLLAGMACWLLFWFGISHVDSIPYLNKYLTKKKATNWIAANPLLALFMTEVVNVMFHGLGTANAVFFTFAGTIVNTMMIFGVVTICPAIANKYAKHAHFQGVSTK